MSACRKREGGGIVCTYMYKLRCSESSILEGGNEGAAYYE